MKIMDAGLLNHKEKNGLTQSEKKFTLEVKNEDERKKLMLSNFPKFQKFIRNSGNQKVAISRAQILFTPKERANISTFFTEEMQSYTDGRNVYVSLFEDALLKDDEGAWLVELIAHTFHEYCHIMYTDFGDMERIMEYSENAFAKNGIIEPQTARAIGSEILNGIIEDPAIEQAGVIEFPGMYPYLWFKNRVIYDQFPITEEATENNCLYRDLIETLLCYGKFGEFPRGYWENYSNSELSEYVDKAILIIDSAIEGKTSKKREQLCEELIDTLLPFIEKLLQDQEEMMQEIEKNLKNQEYKGCSSQKESPSNQNHESRSFRGSQKTRDEKCGRKKDKEEDEKEKIIGSCSGSDAGKQQRSEEKSDESERIDCRQNDGRTEDHKDNQGKEGDKRNKSDDGSSVSKDELERISKAALEEARQETLNLKNKTSEDLERKSSSLANNVGKELENWSEQLYGHTTNRFHEKIVSHQIDSRRLSDDLKSKANRMEKVMRKFLREDTESLYNFKSGKISKKGLTKLALSDNIFYKSGSKGLADAVLYILVDNSGSMSGQKCAEARKASAIIEESLKKLIPVRIALFNESMSITNHVVIRDFDDRTDSNYSYSSMFSISPEGCNADSVNILTAALELKKRKEQRKFLFILSDGIPSAYGSKFSAIDEVKLSVKEARKMGIEIVSIMFGDEDFRNANYEIYRKMYEKNILSCDAQNITEKLPKVLAKIVLS